MRGNLIGSNKSRVKKIKCALGFDDMYIKQGINWDLSQTKLLMLIHNYLMMSSQMNLKKHHQIFMRVILNLMMKQ